MVAVPDAMLRPALEAAVLVARAGQDDKPPRDPPSKLRPFLQFAKLPGRALAVTRRVVDDDDDFRALIVEALTEDDLGRAPWLFLARPPGWEDELEAMAAAAADAEAAAAEERGERDARRRLAGAMDATRRAEELATAARAELADVTAQLAEERRARAGAADDLGALRRQVAAAGAERDRAVAAAAGAVAERDAAAAGAEALSIRLGVLQSEADALAVELAALRAEREAAAERRPSAADLLGRDASGRRQQAAGAALADAAESTADLARALSDAAAALGWIRPEPLGSTSEGGGDAGDPAAPAGDAGAAGARPAGEPSVIRGRDSDGTSRRSPERPRRRSPARLPPGVFDDSTEAADHLVRVPGAILVVDGYNATLSAWPEVALPDQRGRLVDALTGLAARTGVDVRVVFDGADGASPVVPASSRPSRFGVRVSFSAGDEEADEVIGRLVRALPESRAVIVASSDRAVCTDAVGAGANTVSTPQLLAVLRGERT